MSDHASVQDTTDTGTGVRRAGALVLDWDAFRAATSAGRRRHDLEAVVAYGIYRLSDATRADAADRADADTRPADSAAIHGWEDEGGA